MRSVLRVLTYLGGYLGTYWLQLLVKCFEVNRPVVDL